MRRRAEIWSAGFDEQLELIGGDQGLTPTWTGLRIPSFAASPFYLFLLATTDLVAGDEIVGIRQYLELGAPLMDELSPPIAPQILQVTTPAWHGFTDGACSWILTIDPARPSQQRSGPFDNLPSFSFEDSRTPCLTYETATFPSPESAALGYLGLTAYSPPAIWGTSILALRDIRFPWGASSHNAFRWPVDRPMRARLYALVKQTDTSDNTTRFIPSLTPQQFAAVCHEDRFVNAFSAIAQYWRVAGSILTDKSIERMKG